jgi:hypothetical protein
MRQMPMMSGMMPMMPMMMAQMACTMTPEGMTCQMKPMDGMAMEIFTQSCERMMAMMTAAMPMMMCALETK